MAAAAERRDVSSGCCQLERGVRQPAPAESSQVPAVWMVEVTTPVPPIHGQPLTDAAVHCTAWPPPPQLRSGPPPHPPPHPPLATRRRLERVPLRYCAPGGPGRTRGATRRWGAGGGVRHIHTLSVTILLSRLPFCPQNAARQQVAPIDRRWPTRRHSLEAIQHPHEHPHSAA